MVIRISENTRWLFIGVLLSIFFIVSSCSFFCSDKIIIFVGEFESMDVGSRASIQRLSEEIRRCPSAKTYRITWKWKLPSDGYERGWRAVIYKRQNETMGLIGYEYDPESGFSGEVYLVQDDAIHVVAQKAGTLEDFAIHRQSVK